MPSPVSRHSSPVSRLPPLVSRLSALVSGAAAALAAAAPAAPVEVAGRVWDIPDHAALDGTVLTLRVDGSDGRRSATASTEVDLAPFVEAGGVEWRIRAKCKGVEEPAKPWLGFKAQLSYMEADGTMRYRDPPGRTGDFGWYAYRHRTTLDKGVQGPGTFRIGLQEAKGEVSYDLASLEFFPLDSPIAPADDPTLRCEYTERVLRGISIVSESSESSENSDHSDHSDHSEGGSGGAAPRPLRGFMLPSRGLHDDDFAQLAEWGVTLVRYQMSRNWPYRDTERDLADYDEWMEVKLSHLEERVVPFSLKYGIQVIVDLHMPPGGKPADHEMNMFYEPEYAEHFVETWRRIARRFKGCPAIYAYDLVNEPHQTYHAAGGNDYLSLQVRAAKAIREIDPDVPVVMEPIHAASPTGFETLAAVPMKDVIYEVHVYQPFAFTHQGVNMGQDWEPARWPDPEKGWDKEFLREKLAPVREFERKHGAKIYVGEFSAVAWAPGGGEWVRDAASLFNEFGWDWTFHAYREWDGWSVEHEAIDRGTGPEHFRPSADNPRKRALLEALRGD